MKVTKRKIVTETHTYHLSGEIKYIKIFENDKEKSRYLKYSGKKHNGYELSPVYKLDLKVLKEFNPFNGKYEYLKGEQLPEPEEVDINDIIFIQGSTHAFYTIEKKPIPVVFTGSYIDNGNFDNGHYHLKELKSHLENHPNVISCSDIQDIPYYNSEKNRDKHIEVKIYPKVEWLEAMYENDQRYFGLSYITDSEEDFLDIKQFKK